jgi:hypothetical protein
LKLITNLHLVPKLATIVRVIAVRHLVQVFVEFVGLCVYRETFVRSSKPSGHYIYHQINIHQFYVLHTQCFYVFCVDLRTNSDYFPIQY